MKRSRDEEEEEVKSAEWKNNKLGSSRLRWAVKRVVATVSPKKCRKDGKMKFQQQHTLLISIDILLLAAVLTRFFLCSSHKWNALFWLSENLVQMSISKTVNLSEKIFNPIDLRNSFLGATSGQKGLAASEAGNWTAKGQFGKERRGGKQSNYQSEVKSPMWNNTNTAGKLVGVNERGEKGAANFWYF